MTVATHNKYVIAMHVFCNWLVRVHEQRIVAQAAMRHSRIELTTNFYTDPACSTSMERSMRCRILWGSMFRWSEEVVMHSEFHFLFLLDCLDALAKKSV